jgi:hypothetical protein
MRRKDRTPERSSVDTHSPRTRYLAALASKQTRMVLVAGLAVVALLATGMPGLSAKPPEKLFSLEMWPNNLATEDTDCDPATGTDCDWITAKLRNGPVTVGQDTVLTAKAHNRTPGNSNFSSFDVKIPADFEVVIARKTPNQTHTNSGYTISYGTSTGSFSSTPSSSTVTVRVTGLDAVNTNEFAAVDITVRATGSSLPACDAAKDSAKWSAVAYAGNISSTTFRQLPEDAIDPASGTPKYLASHYLTTLISGGPCANRPPTDISLSPNTIAENAGADAVVGTLSTTDPDAGDTFTYTLVSGTDDTDNGSFNISGSSLRASASLDLETKSSYSVRVQSTDSGTLSTSKALTITVTNENETPTAVDDPLISTTTDTTKSGIDVLGNDTDPDAGDTLHISTYQSGSDRGGTVSCGTTCSYTPPTDFTGTDTFTYTAMDSGGLTSTATVTVFVADGYVTECDTEILGAGGGTSASITFLSAGPDDCPAEGKAYAFDVEAEQIELLMGGSTEHVRVIVQTTWAPENVQFPVPASTVKPPLPDGEKEVWCEGTAQAPTMPSGGHTWCRITQSTSIVSSTQMQVSETSLLEGDAIKLRG